MKCPDCKHELPHNESGCLVRFVGENGIEMCRCETKEIDVYKSLLTEAKQMLIEEVLVEYCTCDFCERARNFIKKLEAE